MNPCLLVNGSKICLGDADYESTIAVAYGAKDRPLCLCQNPGIPMYIAAVGQLHIVKRMPNTGNQHSPDCSSFEPPPELSGLAEVSGTAIVEDTDTGSVALKLDFSLSKTLGHRAAVVAGPTASSLKTDGAKLTMRGLLHYLWEEAGLNSWSPAMEGKRSWYVVRRELLAAATTKYVKGHSFSEKLFIPETYSLEHKLEIEHRRTETMASLYAVGKRQELMVLVGEVKAVNVARYGFKVVVKHLPDMVFNLEEQLARRMKNRFKDELALWNADETTHLMMIATFGVGPAGMMAISELSFMLTSGTWLPIETLYDQQLMVNLVHDGRRFRRCLRYNLASDRPAAMFVATDTSPRPVAMYVIAPNVEKSYLTGLQELVEHSDFPAWFWWAGCELCPQLPALVDFKSMELGTEVAVEGNLSNAQ